MGETKILSSLNQIANKIDDEKLKKEIEDISYRLAARFTRINPKFNKLKDRYEKNRGTSWQTPLSQPQGPAKVLRIPDFSGISEKYQEDVLKSIFDNFQKNEDLPKDFFEFILSDARFSNATLNFVKNNKLEETYSRMFEVFEDYVSSLLDKIIQSNMDTYNLRGKLNTLRYSIKFLTPALKAKLLASAEVAEDFRESEFDLIGLISPSFLTNKQKEKESRQRAEQELKQVLSMNNRQILASLKNIANNLDNNGLYQQANSITKVMVKLAQTKSSEVEEFQRRHPSILQELNILKTRKPDDQGFIDLGGIYHSMKTPYWTMPSKINVSQVKDRIKQLNDPQYLRSLAQKRLKFISDKIENQKNISPDDREILLEDLSYLKSFINVSNLNENPESIPQTTRKIQTPFRPTPLSFGEETTEEPKTFDYNKKVYEIVLKNLKDHLPGRSIEELSLMLSDKSNIEGYQIINRNPTLENKIRSEINKFSQNFIDGKAAEKTMQNLFSKKLLQAKYE